MMATSTKRMISDIHISFRRSERSAIVPAKEPSSVLTTKWVISTADISLALPVVCSTHRLSAML
ncbi:hypothetical protein D3C78_1109320 [compost metagenome]